MQRILFLQWTKQKISLIRSSRLNDQSSDFLHGTHVLLSVAKLQRLDLRIIFSLVLHERCREKKKEKKKRVITIRHIETLPLLGNDSRRWKKLWPKSQMNYYFSESIQYVSHGKTPLSWMPHHMSSLAAMCCQPQKQITSWDKSYQSQ